LTAEETIPEFYSYPLSDVSGIISGDTETVDSNFPTKSVWKGSQSPAGDGSDSGPSSRDRSDSGISKQSYTETVGGWSKSDKTPNAEQFLGNPGVNVDTDDPSGITQVVSVVMGDDLIQLFAERSDLSHRHYVDKWQISPKSLK
jgi:hypothetical protein